MYWELGFLKVFLCTIVSPYFIVKSLQLRGRRQIAEPQYCLVRVIVFLIDVLQFVLLLVMIGVTYWVLCSLDSLFEYVS